MKKFLLVGAFLLVGGCSTHSGAVVWRSDPDVVAKGSERSRARSIRVPPGHYPPPGSCRIWYAGVPPGRQPPPTACGSIRRVPRGSFVLYNRRAWDSDYDWRGHERRHAGSVPRVVLRIMATVSG